MRHEPDIGLRCCSTCSKITFPMENTRLMGTHTPHPCTRVYIRNVPVCTGTTRTCVSTCGRGAGTHGHVLNVHTGRFGRTHGEEGGSSPVPLTKICPRRILSCPRGSPKKAKNLNHFKFENRSRTTRSRFLCIRVT